MGLQGAILRRADLTGANLRGAALRDADLCGAALRRADLTGADFTGAKLCGANLYGAGFTGADLTGTDFTGAKLYRADLTGAWLERAQLIKTDLGKQNFEQAKQRAFETDALRGHDGVNQIVKSGRRYRVQKWGRGKYLVRLFGVGEHDYIGITNLNEAAERRLIAGADEVMSRKAINW
jgi:hypothetical protein